MTWRAVGVSVAGTAHRGRGIPCQDAVRHAEAGPDKAWLFVAVADGAGTASHAAVGAGAACDALCDHFARTDPTSLTTRDGMLALFAAARGAVLAEAGRLEVPPRELACTALVTALGPATTAFAQLGDGALVTAEGDGYGVVFWPDPAGYANETDFLTADGFADAVRFRSDDRPVTGLAVLTDGLQRVALDYTARTAHGPFFAPLFARLRDADDPAALAAPLRAFLDSDRVNTRTDDDKTLFLATRRQ